MSTAAFYLACFALVVAILWLATRVNTLDPF
jgi:hypothetical protein